MTTHHEHDLAHGHDHHHHHGPPKNQREVQQLRRVLFLTLVFMVVEAVGGYYTNSLALMSDAVHMLTDTAAIGLSLFAFFMSHRPATDRRTYGFHRLEILAAFLNGILLVLLSGAIIWGAWLRYNQPVVIRAPEMIGISSAGLIFNLIGAWLLLRSDHGHLNVRGALFHVLGDALGSLGAVLAGVLIYYWGWQKADPIVSVVISFIIIASAVRLLFDTAHVILEGAPHHLETDEIRRAIAEVALVTEVHDLHVWSITSGMVSLSVHVVADHCPRHELLCEIRDMLRERFSIEHVTIQIEDQSLRRHEPQI